MTWLWWIIGGVVVVYLGICGVVWAGTVATGYEVDRVTDILGGCLYRGLMLVPVVGAIVGVVFLIRWLVS